MESLSYFLIIVSCLMMIVGATFVAMLLINLILDILIYINSK